MTQANRDLIVELAARHKLPATMTSREFVDAGGLITYASIIPIYTGVRRSTSTRSSKAPSPQTFRSRATSKFELVINLKTARALGSIPASILIQGGRGNRMSRRNFIYSLLISLLVVSPLAAQQRATVPNIGSTTPQATTSACASSWHALRALGYVEAEPSPLRCAQPTAPSNDRLSAC